MKEDIKKVFSIEGQALEPPCADMVVGMCGPYADIVVNTATCLAFCGRSVSIYCTGNTEGIERLPVPTGVRIRSLSCQDKKKDDIVLIYGTVADIPLIFRACSSVLMMYDTELVSLRSFQIMCSRLPDYMVCCKWRYDNEYCRATMEDTLGRCVSDKHPLVYFPQNTSDDYFAYRLKECREYNYCKFSGEYFIHLMNIICRLCPGIGYSELQDGLMDHLFL